LDGTDKEGNEVISDDEEYGSEEYGDEEDIDEEELAKLRERAANGELDDEEEYDDEEGEYDDEEGEDEYDDEEGEDDEDEPAAGKRGAPSNGDGAANKRKK
jgi:hypothetical protein